MNTDVCWDIIARSFAMNGWVVEEVDNPGSGTPFVVPIYDSDDSDDPDTLARPSVTAYFAIGRRGEGAKPLDFQHMPELPGMTPDEALAEVVRTITKWIEAERDAWLYEPDMEHVICPTIHRYHGGPFDGREYVQLSPDAGVTDWIRSEEDPTVPIPPEFKGCKAAYQVEYECKKVCEKPAFSR